jgi:hypothetical protein
MRKLTILRLSVVALLLSFAPSARADQISWSYSFTESSTAIQSNGAITASTSPSGEIMITPLQGTLTGTLPTSATITAANLTALSSASVKSPAQFSDAEYTLIMKLTDLSSGLTVAVTFEGVLNGTVSASGTSLSNSFIGPTSFSYNLNHHIYDISIGNFQAPGAPGSGDLGSIAVDVTVHHNPEPSSLILGALGLPAVGLLRRRRR